MITVEARGGGEGGGGGGASTYTRLDEFYIQTCPNSDQDRTFKHHTVTDIDIEMFSTSIDRELVTACSRRITLFHVLLENKYIFPIPRNTFAYLHCDNAYKSQN